MSSLLKTEPVKQLDHVQPLTDLQWESIKKLLPAPAKRSRGKPHSSWRCVINSIFYVLQTEGKWNGIPKTADYASKSSAHRWFVLWEKNGLLAQLLENLKEHSETTLCFPHRRKRSPLVLEAAEGDQSEPFNELSQRIPA